MTHELDQLLQGARRLVRLPGDGPSPRAVLPGSFNPLHAGHRGMVRCAARRLGAAVHFELSVENVDKPPLTRAEIDRRLRQFDADDAVLLTRAPRFRDKARLLPDATFVMGVDTLERLADPRYADPGEDHQQTLESLCRRARFLVFGRLTGGRFRGLPDLQLPACLAAACEHVPEEEFREDVSSSALRALGRELGG